MHDDGYFDEHIAARYDKSSADMFDTGVVEPAVDFLSKLAGSGRALELGIGTGRIALPLESFSIPFRYAWPAELDLMAQLAGLSLRERWSGWQREPFTSESRQHISVWEKPPTTSTPTTRS